MYILGHQGWTDFFSQFSLYAHFAKTNGHGTVLVVDPTQISFVKRLFYNTSLSVELLQTSSVENGCCVICHQPGNPHRCPRSGLICQYPVKHRYSKIQGLCVFDDFAKWSRVLANCLENGKSFVDAFYVHHDLPVTTLYESFNVTRTPNTELMIPNNQYLVYHEQPSVRIPRENLRKDIEHLSLDRRCEDFFGCIKLIEHAKEIHIVQSSYCMFIYLLQLKYGLFSNIPIFVYASARYNANTNYKNMNRQPQLSNWTFL